jgi:trehalose-6-phosphatase
MLVKSKEVKLKKCVICLKLFNENNLNEHFKDCYNERNRKLFSNFDDEITIIKLFYENKIKNFKEIIYLSDLCEKCEFFKSGPDIEDLLTYKKL